MKNQKKTDAYKNALGTVFLLAGAFFICSTLLSMRTVLADPVAPVSATNTPRLSPARSGATRGTAARSTVAKTSAARSTVNNGQSRSRNVRTRSVSVRSTDGNSRNVSQSSRSNNNSASRSVTSRSAANNNTTMRGTASRNSKRVVARNATSASRVSMVGTGMRASAGTGVTVSYLTNKLYTGNYSNIIDSTTGMISADAYSACLESYYTCMDEICSARSDTKGRCSCAGRATNFLAAETALEKANEELISLSGQLALLVSTKGKDVSEAFKLTDAEKVMNCVSWKDMSEQYGTNYSTTQVKEWCDAHGMYSSSTCKMPAYCEKDGNTFGFDISDINGSGSDILASLKAWADAKDLAKQYTTNDTENLLDTYGTIAGVVNGLSGVTTTDLSEAELDSLANTWGYELFQYAHNNVCGRVLDSCFNGIYEGCGTPPTVKVNNSTGGTATATLCANNATSNCPFNYNSKVAISSNGEVTLNERGSTGTTTTTSATCFGYTSTSGDPYSSLRGPVADARRSIMQKYLLDANAACDVYGTSLKNTAQNINYQKIAAEQALRQKRMEFYNEEQETIENDGITAFTNFNECISEIWDCYNENSDEEGWTTARIKTYCAQVANVPHCYEPMICKPSIAQFNAVIDKSDGVCNYSPERETNTCRNIVTLQEILYPITNGVNITVATGLDKLLLTASDEAKSTEIREACLLKALGCDANNTEDQECLRNWKKPAKATTDD